MTILEAIAARHSVRAYKEQPLTEDVVKMLEEKIAELNRKGNLHMQLILNEPKAFQGTLAKYGKFRGVNNYIVVAGRKAAIKREKSQACLDSSEREQARMQFKADDLDERVGMKDGLHQVRAKKGFSMIGYAKIDLGIAKYHFEIGAGKENFEWV